jgi:hypothetical protein
MTTPKRSINGKAPAFGDFPTDSARGNRWKQDRGLQSIYDGLDLESASSSPISHGQETCTRLQRVNFSILPTLKENRFNQHV